MPSTTRRRLLTSAATVGTTSLAGCSSSFIGQKSSLTLPDSQSWTQFDYDAANTAYNPDARGPSETPTIDWVRDTAGGGYVRRSIQVLVQGHLYVNSGEAYAIDPKTGGVLWHDPRAYGTHTPVLTDGFVLSTSRGLRSVSKSGGIDVLGRRIGYRRWRADPGFLNSPATFANGALFAGVRQREDGSASRIVAIDATDGSVEWAVTVDSLVLGAPAVADEVVYAAQVTDTTNAALYALDAKTGDRLWTRDLGRFDANQAPVVGDGFVYLSAKKGLLAFDAKSGKREWSFEPSRSVRVSPAFAEGTLYVSAFDKGSNASKGRFYAIDSETGQSQWTADCGRSFGGPSVTGDGVYAADSDGTVRSWTHDGRERWRVDIGRETWATPVVAGGRVYVGDWFKRLFCLS